MKNKRSVLRPYCLKNQPKSALAKPLASPAFSFCVYLFLRLCDFARKNPPKSVLAKPSASPAFPFCDFARKKLSTSNQDDSVQWSLEMGVGSLEFGVWRFSSTRNVLATVKLKNLFQYFSFYNTTQQTTHYPFYLEYII